MGRYILVANHSSVGRATDCSLTTNNCCNQWVPGSNPGDWIHSLVV